MTQRAAPFVPYGQGRARGLAAEALGTHGAAIDQLTALGLPVVPGLTVPVAEAALLREPDIAAEAVELVEQLAARKVGDPTHSMLLRLIASPPRAGVPGVPPELVGIGISPANLAALDDLVGCDGIVYDVFASAIRYVGEHALGVPSDEFADAEFRSGKPDERVDLFLSLCRAAGEQEYPSDPSEQVALGARALLARWRSPRARRGRRSAGLPDDLGIAVHLQAVRIGVATHSGHGVAESRDPRTGSFAATGTFHRGVRRGGGEDRPGEPLSALPAGGALLEQALRTLEAHLHGVARVEFEVRDDELALIAAHRVERPSAYASLRIAAELADAGVLDDAAAVAAVRTADLASLLHPQLRLSGREQEFARGLAASVGAAVGRIAMSSDQAVEWAGRGEPVVLVARETTPGDLPGLLAARAVVTSRGGLAAHAAVVARGLGRPAVCGAASIGFDIERRVITSGGVSLAEGEVVAVDGSTGTIYVGTVEVVPPHPGGVLDSVLARADRLRRLGVRANADTGREAALAVQFGAEGIGLCRTEHQFLGDRLPIVRRFLLASDPVEEAGALTDLAAAQREDFLDLLAAIGPRPVTVRLLDAPLHEFLGEEAQEANPMLGLRGVRLALLRKELYPAQARALFLAWTELATDGVAPSLEVMVPLVALAGELALVVDGIAAAAREVSLETGVSIPYKVGTMVETPRAALIAEKLVEHAEFLSFGTNDLTQLTYGFSRDDVEAQVLATYVERGLLTTSPFARLDPDGVGELVAIAVRKARAARPDVKLGICGEHGGDAESIDLCERLGLDYVSCSPSRVPGARLAAAHARIGGPR